MSVNSPNFEDRFANINIQNGGVDGKLRKLPNKQEFHTTIPKLPFLSTSKRAETRAITRSQSSTNIPNLHIAKTPSRISNTKSMSTAKKTNRVISSHLNEVKSVGGTPYRELSYMRDTSSSSRRKSSNPFNVSPSDDVRKVSNGSRPSDITNVHYEKPKKPTPKRHVSPPVTQRSDVYTRLYNDAKKAPVAETHRPIKRSSSSFSLEKTIVKVRDLTELYQIIYDEDPYLFEDYNDNEFYANEPNPPQQFTDDQTTQNPLDIYERGEILRRKDIYFLPGDQAHRNINIRNYSNNYGFDDSTGNYVVVPYDHINYRYQILSVLGNGAFGNVVKCIDKKYRGRTGSSKKVVAIKIIKNDLNWSLQAIYEIKMLKHLNETIASKSEDPYVNDYGTYDCPVLTYFNHFHFRGHMCIVTEPLSINLYSLLEIIKFQGLSLSLIQIFVKKILLGLEYIHSKNVLHCDIKPENIMIKLPPHFDVGEIDDESIIIKIVDFGSSCFTNEISYTYIQSRFYRAPEIIVGAKYDKMIDIWSLGCIIAELFTGDPLLPGKNELEQIGLILELFGSPNSSLVQQQRNQLMRSIRDRKSTAKLNDSVTENPTLKGGIADEKSVRKTLLYTLFDIEGKINMQFLNMRIQAASSNNPNFFQSRKNFKVSSKSLEVRLKLRSCDEDRRTVANFMKFLNRIFKWNPNERSDASELLKDVFLN